MMKKMMKKKKKVQRKVRKMDVCVYCCGRGFQGVWGEIFCVILCYLRFRGTNWIVEETKHAQLLQKATLSHALCFNNIINALLSS